MPTVTYDHATILALQAAAGLGHEPYDWEARLSNIGCVVEANSDEQIEIEVFPDRPDLLSVETMTFAARSFLQNMPANPKLDVVAGDIEMTVDSSLKEVRPVILGAVVRGVDIGEGEDNEKFIQSLMDHQEKLHLTLGRRRKLASIGVHDLASLAPPFTVTTVPRSHRFIPLGMNEEMSIGEILEKHPKGVEYAHLLEEFDRYPVILDRYERVLSMPPIINGNHTTVNDSTTNFFIDVTGFDERSCEASLLLVCLALSMRGGVVESIQLTRHDGSEIVVPNGKPRRHRLPESLLQTLLGRKLSEREIADSISRMGGLLVEARTATDGPLEVARWSDTAVGQRELIIEMPRWRADIMHPVDLVEDIATGIGYEELGTAHSALSIEGVQLPQATLTRRLRTSMQSQGLQEVLSLTLSSDQIQFQMMDWPPNGDVTRIANPITNEHTMLRQRVLPSLLQLLAANRHHELPQRVYEVGEVVRYHRNTLSLGWACAETAAGFTAAKGLAQALLRDIGTTALAIEVTFEPVGQAAYGGVSEYGEFGPWLLGRGAKVIIDNTVVGQFGEINPAVGHRFGLKVPIHAGEFDVEALRATIPDPVL